MKIKYLRINESGEKVSCGRDDATHVRISQQMYDALREGNYGCVKDKIALVKAQRETIKSMSALASETNDQFNEYRDVLWEREDDIFLEVRDMLNEIDMPEIRC